MQNIVLSKLSSSLGQGVVVVGEGTQTLHSVAPQLLSNLSLDSFHFPSNKFLGVAGSRMRVVDVDIKNKFPLPTPCLSSAEDGVLTTVPSEKSIIAKAHICQRYIKRISGSQLFFPGAEDTAIISGANARMAAGRIKNQHIKRVSCSEVFTDNQRRDGFLATAHGFTLFKKNVSLANLFVNRPSAIGLERVQKNKTIPFDLLEVGCAQKAIPVPERFIASSQTSSRFLVVSGGDVEERPAIPLELLTAVGEGFLFKKSGKELVQERVVFNGLPVNQMDHVTGQITLAGASAKGGSVVLDRGNKKYLIENVADAVLQQLLQMKKTQESMS